MRRSSLLAAHTASGTGGRQEQGIRPPGTELLRRSCGGQRGTRAGDERGAPAPPPARRPRVRRPAVHDGHRARHAVARRAYQLADGRLSVIGQMGLAVLQVADWLRTAAASPSGGGDRVHRPGRLLGLGVDAGDDAALKLLRRVGRVMDATVESRNGRVVKRLGDGTMVVFESPDAAVAGTKEALDAVADIRCDGYRPQLRAGVHFGEPTRIGGDYLGVDVTVAARLCEAAGTGRSCSPTRSPRGSTRRPRASGSPRRCWRRARPRTCASSASAPRLFAWPTARRA